MCRALTWGLIYVLHIIAEVWVLMDECAVAFEVHCVHVVKPGAA